MSTIRDQHWTDVSKGGRNRTRTISNFINYWNKQKKQFDPVDLQIEDDLSIPPDWIGQFEFKYQIKRGNMQIYAHDLTKPNESAVVGVRSARHPLYWMNIKALNTNTTAHTIDLVNNIIKWDDVWSNCDLQFQAARRKIIKLITLKTSDHPDYFDFSLKMSPAANIVENNGALDFIMAGKQQMKLIGPYGWDSSNNAGLNSNIKVDLSILDNSISRGYRYVKIRLTPDIDDLAGAIYPVYLDPSVNISGTVFVEDTFLDSRALYLHTNYGSYVYMGWGHSVSLGLIFRQLMRVDEGEIPAGTITDFKLHYWRQPWAYSITAGMTEIFSIKDANDWVEGTANGTVQAGSPGWGHAKHDTQNWAGSVGCGTSGTDYDADGSPPGSSYPIYTSGPSVERIETLKTEWATDWRDGLRVNNGILIKEADEASGKIVLVNSTEAGSDQPYFEVDYTPAVTFTPAIVLNILKKKIL